MTEDGSVSLLELEHLGQVRLTQSGEAPLPLDARAIVNGAPVTEQSHEFVLRKPDARNQ